LKTATVGGKKNLQTAAPAVESLTESMNAMISRPSNWRKIRFKFAECLRDDRGIAMTEYILIMLVVLPAIFYLFNPDNGFYKGIRDQYELTTTLLMFPGP
jgi:hypothetical protein